MLRIYDPLARPTDFFIKMRDRGKNFQWDIVDKNGTHVTQGTLFQMNKKTGKIYRHSSVNPDFGFDLDECARLKVNT